MENKIICMRGSSERSTEVKEFFKQHGVRNDFKWDYSIDQCIYYVDSVINVVRRIDDDTEVGEKLIPYLTELPPLKEVIEEVEFWLKPLEPVVVKDEEADHWIIDIFRGRGNCEVYPFECITSSWTTCLPFNKDTEKLIDTQDEPKVRYIFKGIKSYFDEK